MSIRLGTGKYVKLTGTEKSSLLLLILNYTEPPLLISADTCAAGGMLHHTPSSSTFKTYIMAANEYPVALVYSKRQTAFLYVLSKK
jgi:hypothetical protein